MPFYRRFHLTAIALSLLLALHPLGAALAQDADGAASPAGLSMLMLFLGIAAIIGVFVARWSQSTGEDDD